LDWSENPLVALYFAVADGRYASEDGVIWVFQDRTGVKASVAPLQLDHPRPYRAWYALPHPIPRTVAQRGSLTSQPDLTTPFDRQEFAKDQSLEKFTVPNATKRRLRTDLEVIGITEQRLFPDLVDLGDNRPADLVGECVRITCEMFPSTGRQQPAAADAADGAAEQ
jgi:hypothetical protein